VRISELRTQTDDELAFMLEQNRKRIFELRFKTSEELGDVKEVSRLRRDVARILTLQGERVRAKATKSATAAAATKTESR
jgi:ribosomal protein L29